MSGVMGGVCECARARMLCWMLTYSFFKQAIMELDTPAACRGLRGTWFPGIVGGRVDPRLDFSTARHSTDHGPPPSPGRPGVCGKPKLVNSTRFSKTDELTR